MPITLDPSLPSSLYPLAWLIGSWRGEGALHRPGAAADQRVEQQLTCAAREDGTLAWTSLLHVVDAPAPLPPTSAFAKDAPEAQPAPSGSGERTLLMRETGTWTVGDPLPGQDLERAAAAKPGDPAGTVSYALTARFEREGAGQEWAGEARGPRIQLARRGEAAGSRVAATRMFGYVGGRLMWLWEQAPDTPAGPEGSDWPGAELAPFLSLELDRA